MALRWLRDREEALDACSDAAAKLWAARETWLEGRAVYPWFYVTLRNLCFDRLRRAGRHTEGVEGLMVPADQESSLLAREQSALLARAVASLDAPMREVLEARHFDELAYAEIAAALQLPEGTVMSRLYRARKRVRAFMEENR